MIGGFPHGQRDVRQAAVWVALPIREVDGVVGERAGKAVGNVFAVKADDHAADPEPSPQVEEELAVELYVDVLAAADAHLLGPHGLVVAVNGQAFRPSIARASDQPTPAQRAQADVVALGPHLDLGQPRSLPSIVLNWAGALCAQCGVLGLIDRPQNARGLAQEVEHVAALFRRQAVPAGLADFVPLASRAGRSHDLDELEHVADKPGVRFLRGLEVKLKDALGFVQAFAAAGRREAEGLALGESREAVGREHLELQKGIAQAFRGEFYHDLVRPHQATQVDFDPPIAEGGVQVRLPEGLLLAVYDLGGLGQMDACGPHPARYACGRHKVWSV